jgi:predicted NAD-dependent protein-ADP-ribosyltransferase YbiA (DUF1768 family)
MVQSILIPSITYGENANIDSHDVGHICTLYEMELNGLLVAVVLGKPRLEKKSVLYCPLYSVGDDKEYQFPTVKSKIGIVEAPVEQAVSILGNTKRDADVSLDKMSQVLLFDFVTKDYLTSLQSHPETYHKKIYRPSSPEEPPPGYKPPSPDGSSPPLFQEEVEVDEDDEDLFSIVVPKKKNSETTKQMERIIERGPFQILPGFLAPLPLTEETLVVSQKIKKEYQESPKDTWIEKFMHNSNYIIHEVESNGDCFFAVVRDAYASIGRKTTVEKLRTIVANKITNSLYELRRDIYIQIQQELKRSKPELSNLKENIKKKQKEPSPDVKELNDMIHDYNKKLDLYKKQEQDTFSEFKYMKNIHSFEDFRKFIQTSDYWIDSWSISVLEKELGFKIIIFEEESFGENARDNVLQCGEASQEETVKPEFYIMTTYSGNHYRLIGYKDRKIFTFPEIPYDVKILIVKKCMEKNSGEFGKIIEFRDWKHRFVSEDDADADADDANEANNVGDNLFDKNIVFLFYDHSPSKPAPGKGSGESIPEYLRTNPDYIELNTIVNWRRMLDDAWEQEGEKGLFQLDGVSWKSVNHYMLGVQFKKGFPNIYRDFSLDGNTDISRDVDLAKKAISKKRDVVTINGQKKKVKPDVGFHTEMDLENHIMKGREDEEREKAVRAKFDQNLTLKKILLLTKPAHLMHFIRAQPPESDLLLMSIRALL